MVCAPLPLDPMSDTTPTPAGNTDPSLQSEAKRLADAARDRATDAVEEIKLASNQIVDQVREAIEDANVKRVTIKREGKTLLEIPLTVGVGGVAAALLMQPGLAAVGALAALVTDVTVVIERDTGAEAVANAADPVATDQAGGPSGDDAKTVGKPSAD